MSRKLWVRFGLLYVLICLLLVSLMLGWPWAHQFNTYTWPGPFGWFARDTPGNVVAGFLQITIGFLLGYGAHRLGWIEKAKGWLFKEAQAERKRVAEHDKWLAQVVSTIHSEVTGTRAPHHPEHGSL